MKFPLYLQGKAAPFVAFSGGVIVYKESLKAAWQRIVDSSPWRPGLHFLPSITLLQSGGRTHSKRLTSPDEHKAVSASVYYSLFLNNTYATVAQLA